MEKIELKECRRCGKALSMTDFHKNRAAPDGRSSYCVYCAREMKQESTARLKAGMRMRRDNHTLGVQPKNAPSSDNPLSTYSNRALMQELHRRGYEGKLIYTAEVDLSKM